MADWELGHVIAELNSGRFLKSGAKLPVKSVGATMKPITTMGGLTITPDTTVDAVDLASVALLLLPGADTWADPANQPVIKLSKELLEADVPLAAICGATGALAQAGMLNTVRHTSNSLQYLQMSSPDYTGADYYQDELAVTDGNLITAGASSPIEFAYHTFKKLGVFEPAHLEYWYSYFSKHSGQDFMKLYQATAK
jgi:putative intracellular protease/amidase